MEKGPLDTTVPTPEEFQSCWNPSVSPSAPAQLPELQQSLFLIEIPFPTARFQVFRALFQAEQGVQARKHLEKHSEGSSPRASQDHSLGDSQSGVLHGNVWVPPLWK